MAPSRLKAELKIFTPIGQLGQGFSEEIFWDTLKSGVDAIIADGGSTDSGPGRLALGKPNVPYSRLQNDINLFVRAAHEYNVPTLIGSIGGDGENAHVDKCIEFVREAVKANGYRSMKVIGIYSEIPKDLIRQKMGQGLISGCGPGVPELTEHDVETSTRIVAQMGLEPYLKAMKENPDFDIIIGGRAYDPAPYAAFCLYNGFNDMGINYAMGKLLECGAMCAVPKTKEGLCIVRHDSFDFTPLDPKAKATTISVASHFLYEHTRPDQLHGPGGVCRLEKTTYEQIDERTVRIRNAYFEAEPEGQYTVKLEGARVNGYQTIFLGAFRDPILLQQVDSFIEFVNAYVKDKFQNVDYDIKIHKYGINGVMGSLEPDTTIGKEVFIAAQVRAPTQELADNVASMTKHAIVHGPYQGQVATAGNFAWPFTPAEISMGPIPEFCVYHIMHQADPVAMFPIKIVDVTGENKYTPPPCDNSKSQGESKASAKKSALLSASSKKYWLLPEPAPNTCYLADIASIVRSKNAGPYELTFDVMFPNDEVYQKVKDLNLLTADTIAKLYKIPVERVIASVFFDQARAYKATIIRPAVSGGFAETDTHGSQQHIPLMYLSLPFGRP